MCAFITRSRDSVVRAVSVHDVLQGNVRLPFTSRPAWLAVQSECPDLRRTHAHLIQGTRPSKKLTNIKDVKRYLQVASIANDGLLVVQRHDPLVTDQRVHYRPTSGFGWPFDCPPHSAWPPILSPVEDGCQTLSVRPRPGQGSLSCL